MATQESRRGRGGRGGRRGIGGRGGMSGLGRECIGKFCEEYKEKHSDIIILHRHDAELHRSRKKNDKHNRATTGHGEEEDSCRRKKSNESRERQKE